MEALADETGEAPPALAARPALPADLVPYWEAFAVLSCARGVGHGPQRITLGDVLAYCELRGVDDSEERVRLVHLVQAMDDEYFALAAGRLKQKRPAPTSRPTPRPRRR